VPFELINTSAPRGIDPGSRGFTTVAITQGLVGIWRKRLESMSGYFIEDGISGKPAIFMHTTLAVSGSSRSVLSRIGSSGLDYSGRPNRIAHHILLDENELPNCGPAELSQQHDVFCGFWDSDPKILPPKSFSDVKNSPTPCHYWKEVTGNSANAGYLLRHLFSDSNKPLVIVAREDTDCLQLFIEAIALLNPLDRWKATYSTLTQQLPTDAKCAWQVVIENTKSANSVIHRPGVHVINLSEMPPIVDDIYSESAQAGAEVQGPQARRESLVVPLSKKKQKDMQASLTETDDDFFELEQIETKSEEPGVSNARNYSTETDESVLLDQEPLVDESFYQSPSHDLGWQYRPNEDTRASSRLPWILTIVASLLCVVLLAILLRPSNKQSPVEKKPSIVARENPDPPVDLQEQNKENSESPTSEEAPGDKLDDDSGNEDDASDAAVEKGSESGDESTSPNKTTPDNTASNNEPTTDGEPQHPRTSPLPKKSVRVKIILTESGDNNQEDVVLYVGEMVEFKIDDSDQPGFNIESIHWTLDDDGAGFNITKKTNNHSRHGHFFKKGIKGSVECTIIYKKIKDAENSDPKNNQKKLEYKVPIKKLEYKVPIKTEGGPSKEGNVLDKSASGSLKYEKWKGRHHIIPKEFFSSPLESVRYISLTDSHEALDWKPVRDAELSVLGWRIEAGGSVVDVKGQGPDFTFEDLYIKFGKSVDFLIVAESKDNSWWTLLSEKLDDKDSKFARGIEPFIQTHKGDSNYTLSSEDGFGNAGNPDAPMWPHDYASSVGSDEWTLDSADGTSQVKLTRKNDGLKWEVGESSDFSEKIRFVDRHGRQSWILDFSLNPNK
jgi:hypothetical protein